MEGEREHGACFNQGKPKLWRCVYCGPSGLLRRCEFESIKRCSFQLGLGLGLGLGCEFESIKWCSFLRPIPNLWIVGRYQFGGGILYEVYPHMLIGTTKA